MKTHKKTIVITLLTLTVCFFNISISLAKEYQKTHDCDKAAAHPKDVNAWAKGVSEDDLVIRPAITYCTKATKKHPETARFHFQLGRALLKAKQYDKAFNSLMTAAESEHPAAFAYLGDMSQFGLGRAVDEETALQLYQASFEGGFEPAKSALQGLTAKKAKRVFTADGFKNSRFMSSLYHARFDKIHKNDMAIFYVEGINEMLTEGFSEVDKDCAKMVNPRLDNKIQNRKDKQAGLHGNTDLSSPQGWLKALQDFEKIGQMGLNAQKYKQKAIDAKTSRKTGQKDVVVLVGKYGCSNNIIKEIYANIEDFVYQRYDLNSGLSKTKGLSGFAVACVEKAYSYNSSRNTATSTCFCFANKFEKANVSKKDINWLNRNYDQGTNMSSIINKYQGLKQSMNQCLFPA